MDVELSGGISWKYFRSNNFLFFKEKMKWKKQKQKNKTGNEDISNNLV